MYIVHDDVQCTCTWYNVHTTKYRQVGYYLLIIPHHYLHSSLVDIKGQQTTMSHSSVKNVLPESVGGKGIPTNAFDLMKELRSQERGDAAKERQQQMQNRKRKHEIRQETVEKQLMAAEDYTFTLEGARRFRAMEERIIMCVSNFF